MDGPGASRHSLQRDASARSKPSVAHMMDCAPIEATRNFHRTNAETAPEAYRSMPAMKGPCISVQQKQIVLAEVAVIPAWQAAVRRRTEARGFQVSVLRAAPLPAPQSATYMTSACAAKETRYDPARIRARR
jgi:hypothetical protein